LLPVNSHQLTAYTGLNIANTDKMTEERTLSTHFNDLWKKYSLIEDLPNENQQQLNECIAQARHLMASVEQLDLYSENEDFEEIATSDIKFLLLPALLGKLHQLRTVKDRSERPAILESSCENFKKFLRSCALYGVGNPRQLNRFLSDNELPGNEVKMGSDGNPDLGHLVSTREEKIRKYKEEKERKEQISELQKNEANLDDTDLRKYWKLQILQEIHNCLQQLDSIEQERKILKFMSSKACEAHKREKPLNRNNNKSFTPFMLTKDRMQANVFGQGYPSLPTMTLDEFYEREAAQGRMGNPQTQNKVVTGSRVGRPANGKEEESQEGGKPESEDDDDDEEKVMKQREMDEWRDEHRIGDGNRYRKG